jgi:hypothetical protein
MQNLLPMRPIDGWRIFNPLGVWVGNIDTLLLDSTSGLARFAWTSFFNIPLRQVALPWRALSYSATLRGFVTLVCDQRLDSAPEVTVTQRASEVENALLHHFDLTRSSS